MHQQNEFHCQCGNPLCHGECMVIQDLEDQLHERLQREIILNIVQSSNEFIARPSAHIHREHGISLLKRVRRLTLIAVCIGLIEAPSLCLSKLICDSSCFDSDECRTNVRKWLEGFHAKLKECPTPQVQTIFRYYTTLDNAEQELRGALRSKQSG